MNTKDLKLGIYFLLVITYIHIYVCTVYKYIYVLFMVNIGPAEMSENSHKIVENIVNVKFLKVGLYLQIFKAFYLKEINTKSCP